MTIFLGVILGLLFIFVIYYFGKIKNKKPDLSFVPEKFIVFDLETTGLDSRTEEIIEIGAIKVNRDSSNHEAFEALIKPNKKIPRKIANLTGITQKEIDEKGENLRLVLIEFFEFIGDLPLVSFNAEFDMAFLNAAAQKNGLKISNRVACALKMSRRAWPNRKSYKLADISRDGNLNIDNSHRALADCQRTVTIYMAAASILKTSGH